MSDLLIMFGIPFLIGLSLGFVFKGSINRYEKSKRFDKHMDSLFKE
jgi:hypothetical protein